jgi:outer membrane protein assembly factor BamB
MKRVVIALIIAVTFFQTSFLFSQELTDWPKWRGPTGTGANAAADPPTTWSQTENIRWKADLPGNGSSTPIVWQNKIFLLTAISVDKDGEGANSEPPAAGRGIRPPVPTNPYQFVVLCIDRTNGKTLWQKIAREEVPHEGHHKDHGFASSSPVTDGKLLFVNFGSRGLYCYDLDGNLKWEKNLGRMQTRNGFGEGASPALHGDTLVITWDHEGEDFIAAFDKKTGDELWRQKRDEPTSWATPLIVEHEGQAQVVTAATGRVRSYDLATGKELWHAEGLTTNAIPSPVTADGIVYLTSGYQGNKLLAIRLGSTGDLTGTAALLWNYNKRTPYVPSPLLYDNRLYFFASNTNILTCLDVNTGKPVIDGERVGALPSVYASPIGASGRVYLMGRDGTCVVIKHADKFEPLATNRLDDPIDASPVAVDKELFLRSRKHLYCIAE